MDSDVEIALPRGPSIIRIDRQQVLNSALSSLSLSIEAEDTFSLDGSTYVSRVTVAGLINKETLQIESRPFYGDFTETSWQAIHSAYDAILSHLQDGKLIVIQDINYDALVAARKQLAALTSWSMIFEEASIKLKETLTHTNATCSSLLSSIEQVLQDHLPQLPITFEACRSCGQHQQRHICYSGTASPFTALDSMAKMLADIHSQLLKTTGPCRCNQVSLSE
ncbi:hypothetical protein ACP4OV_017854 [Aristida adscensionis]